VPFTGGGKGAKRLEARDLEELASLQTWLQEAEVLKLCWQPQVEWPVYRAR